MSSKAIIGRRAAPAASDHDLVCLARRGDETAMAEIVRRYERPLRSYCAGLVGRDRAQDAVQQAFVQVVVALRAEEERDLVLRPWLYRIARNCSIDLLRKDTGDHDQLDPEFDGVPQPPAIAEQREEIESLVTALRSLPEGQRRALTLREFEGRSYREIAGELGQTASSARQLIFRARTSLRGGVAALLPFAPLRAWLIAHAPASEALVLAGASGARGTSVLDSAAAVAAASVALWGGGVGAGVHAAAGPIRADAAPPPSADSAASRSSAQPSAVAPTLAFVVESSGPPLGAPRDEPPKAVQAPVPNLPTVVVEPPSLPVPAAAEPLVSGPSVPAATPSGVVLDVVPVAGAAPGAAPLPGGAAAQTVPAVPRAQVAAADTANAGGMVSSQRDGSIALPKNAPRLSPAGARTQAPSTAPTAVGTAAPTRAAGATGKKRPLVQVPAGLQPVRPPKRAVHPANPTRVKPVRPALVPPAASASNPEAPTRR